jgi:agmatinase
MTTFDSNAPAPKDSGIFGLPYSVDDAKLVLIPVPWEATTSYGGGTSKGPEAIYQASKQVDLFDIDLGNFFEVGIAMLDIPNNVQQWNVLAKKAATEVITAIIEDREDASTKKALALVNEHSLKVNNYTYQTTKHWLNQGKFVGLVGGDHSTPFGAIKAFLEKYPDMGILHIDAHADLRHAYEGFEDSHASIMYNVMTKTALKTLVQVGIRDFCEEEYNFIHAHPEKIHTFFDAGLAEKKMQGQSWSTLCDHIIQKLPPEVFISFDIDGLDPRFCPNTGTPVPGGLEFCEVLYLFKKVVQSGRTIIGFDLNEVSPGETEWDANVGARILYKLCGWTLSSNTG